MNAATLSRAATPAATPGAVDAHEIDAPDGLSSAWDPAAAARLARALRAHETEAARCLMAAVAGWEKYAPAIAAAVELDEFLRRDYGFLVDYLVLRFSTGSTVWRDLLVGEKVRQAYYEAESSVEAQTERRRSILHAERDGLCALLRAELGTAEIALLVEEFAGLERLLTTRAGHHVEVLLVGDCLYLDLMAFLVGASLQDGISIQPTLVTTHHPAEMRNALRRLGSKRFDLVFFSPFTYEFSANYNRLMWWHQGAMAPGRVRALATEAVNDALASTDLLLRLFDCPVFVHNSAHIRRHDGSLAERIKNAFSWRARRAGRTHVNAALAQAQDARRAAGIDKLFLVDETRLLADHGETALGRLFYDHDSRHPAAMGRWLAEVYRDLLYVQVHLVKKKLVVCDLDNTLWEGVIGEGAVRHYADRQRILARLKERGVVLAINSKNDPRNVHWTGAVLEAEDFVSVQINWGGKVDNMRRIAAHLNLKTKDFVFVDDRADEREMMRVALPEVGVLDATDERAWRLLAIWADCLAGADATDRTRLYREKDARDSFLKSVSTEEEDPAALFAALGLSVQVRLAGESDLKRVVELINRTNQFNTAGTRTSLREAGEWLAAGDRAILVVDCADKFGTMGTISIAVAHFGPAAVDVPAFVLSCRVFGYGIERVVVNAIKRAARRAGLPIVAPLVETAHNGPCRGVFREAGFTGEGGAWRWSGAGADPDPSWLAVTFAEACRARFGG